jgi:uncharacterized membrane protein
VIYLLLKSIHIFSVILALGSNLTYGFLTYRAEREPIHLLFTLNTIRWIDKYIANRSYIITLITGLLLVWNTGYSVKALWIWFSLLLFCIVALLGITLYAPVIKRQVELVERNQLRSAEYQSIKTKSNRLGLFVTLLVVIILVLMVVKPT